MNSPKILVAEDERDIRELIVFSLKLGNYDVTDVPNGEEAVRTALDLEPDLILLDVRMPRMTGYEACKALKQEEKTKDIPIVFLSAKGQEGEIQQGKDLGAEAYFLKPFAPDDLIKQVTDILHKYNKLQG
ncbi:MAG: response regulator [Chloroflexota bacterium]